MRARLLILMTLVLSAVTLGWTQAPQVPIPGTVKNPSYGAIRFRANLGSFKIINGSGRVEVSFSGSMLISGLKPGTKLSVTGQLSKQYDSGGRTVYFGVGKVVVDGEWRGIQVFGKKMDGLWYGKGVIRLSGEYDKNLNPGDYWYEKSTEPGKWPSTGSFDLTVPPPGNAPPPIRKPIK